MRDLYAYLCNPVIGLTIASNPSKAFEEIWPTKVRETLKKMYRVATEFQKDPQNREWWPISIHGLMMDLLPKSTSVSYQDFSAAIREIHAIMEDYATDFFPVRMQHLFTSDGLVTNIDDPAELLCAIFNPRNIPGIGNLPPAPPLEDLRSWIALRTWFCAIRWITERNVIRAGREQVQLVTAEFERSVFFRFDKHERMGTLHAQFNPSQGFTFAGISPKKGEYTTPLCFSRRIIKTKTGLVNVYFTGRVKSPRSTWSKGRQVNDLVAETMIFLNDQDYAKCKPMLLRKILSNGNSKVIEEKRTRPNPNENNFSDKGVFWSGEVYLDGIESELECSTLARYFNGTASLTLFNHRAYEARRFTRQREDSPSLCEILFPEMFYMPLDTQLRVEMVTRRFATLVDDLYEPKAEEARRVIKTMKEILLRHPAGLDNPRRISGLIIP